MYGLSSQLKRAVVSIPSNIAEGAARKGEKEFIQSLYIALGSVAEVETQIILSQRLGFIENVQDVNNSIQKVIKLIYGLIRYLKTK
jgi:four helix bundle protein